MEKLHVHLEEVRQPRRKHVSDKLREEAVLPIRRLYDKKDMT